SFIINTLKPHIDSTFRTLPGRDFTAIGGSSLGGLISMYAAAEYPDVFSKAGVFSPAFQVTDSCFLQVMQKTFDEDIRVYFVAGHNESSGMIPDILHMQEILLQQGVDQANVKVVDELDGAHSEWFWAREYPDAYEWLFEDLVLLNKEVQQKKIKVFPNPATDFLVVESSPENFTYIIYSIIGSIIVNGKSTDYRIDISSLPPGVYVLQIEGQEDNARFLKF
ncbi:MAG TPA: alpha/beta hydrolase-fold protein, partial [Saprospiraceae bacterium]|nr:alpha/beta hydrolase-fold protein [Saprospiraceae bacterium]